MFISDIIANCQTMTQDKDSQKQVYAHVTIKNNIYWTFSKGFYGDSYCRIPGNVVNRGLYMNGEFS